jgi:hypothetical protein
MQHYHTNGDNSEIAGFDASADSFLVVSKNGWYSLYTSASAGGEKIETMKQLAAKGTGLDAYIGAHVKESFARKWKGNRI